ncbi:hypothetical protein K0M31_003028 [Melipona bicolor]|uniref:Transmembrane protein n=1 Tax=Melipona bicolor TaxID=60889 RepID=A0AA40G156_9HYME|nr:hypothetical protein K0M31_003028 [Melipona bicolor]
MRIIKENRYVCRTWSFLLILLAILAPRPCFATSINYEDLQPAATFHGHRHEQGAGNDRHAVRQETKLAITSIRATNVITVGQSCQRSPRDSDKGHGYATMMMAVAAHAIIATMMATTMTIARVSGTGEKFQEN